MGRSEWWERVAELVVGDRCWRAKRYRGAVGVERMHLSTGVDRGTRDLEGETGRGSVTLVQHHQMDGIRGINRSIGRGVDRIGVRFRN